MKHFALIPMLALASILTGCSTTPSTSTGNVTPQTAVFQIKQNYDTALSIALAYEGLPACGSPGATKVCSDSKVKVKIKEAKDVASPAVAAAEATVRAPDFDASAAAKVTDAANQAVIALTAIVAALQTTK